jgi:hypothetical protein
MTFPEKISRSGLNYKIKKKKKKQSKLTDQINSSNQTKPTISNGNRLETINESSEAVIESNFEFLDSVKKKQLILLIFVL